MPAEPAGVAVEGEAGSVGSAYGEVRTVGGDAVEADAHLAAGAHRRAVEQGYRVGVGAQKALHVVGYRRYGGVALLSVGREERRRHVAPIHVEHEAARRGYTYIGSARHIFLARHNGAAEPHVRRVVGRRVRQPTVVEVACRCC